MSGFLQSCPIHPHTSVWTPGHDQWSHSPPQPWPARNWHRSWENTHPAATYTYRSTNVCAPTYAHIRKNQSLWCALMQWQRHLQRHLKIANVVFLFHVWFLFWFIRKVLLQCFPVHLYPSLSNRSFFIMSEKLHRTDIQYRDRQYCTQNNNKHSITNFTAKQSYS